MALVLDLARSEGQPQRIGAGNNTLRIRGTVENVVGTPFADAIFGNAANNRLDGLAGDDWLLPFRLDTTVDLALGAG